MDLAIEVILYALALMSIATAVYYGAVIFLVLRHQRTEQTLRQARALPAPASGWPALVVIVPAHNEEDVIGRCARSLLESDYPDLRVVFALDRCTDRTHEAIADVIASNDAHERTDIVRIEHCPDDWAGKTHALHSAYKQSRLVEGARRVLFVDADTWFEPDALRTAVALMEHRNVDLLSLLPTLTVTQWFERIVQPAAGLELVRQFPLTKVNRPGARRHFANGQFMLWRRDVFDRVGGHERVKGELLEDIALARVMHKPRGEEQVPAHRGACFMADGLMGCRMYGSWAQFQRGWRRIYAEAARRYPAQIRRHARRVRLLGAVAPVSALMAIAAGAGAAMGGVEAGRFCLVSGLGGAVLFIVAMVIVYRAQRLAVPYVLLYPIGAWLLADLMHEAARDLEDDRPTEWAGRRYHRARERQPS